MQHSGSGSQIVEFPRETEGLSEARTAELIELTDGDEFDLEIRPVKKRIGDATVRMLSYNGSVPGPTLKIEQGSTITVHVTTRGDRALARPAAREPLRRHARNAGADSGRGDLHLSGACAGRGRALVPPAHPRGLRAGDGPVREHPRYPERTRLLAAREPRGAAHARRHPDRGRTDRRLSRSGNDARGDGPLRQCDARRRRS